MNTYSLESSYCDPDNFNEVMTETAVLENYKKFVSAVSEDINLDTKTPKFVIG